MSDFKYLVTVIIPVYNTQDYIEECVLSIENQKMDVSKIEVLLINDGSKDQSGNICENLSKKYANITYICKDNSGVSDTRNIGIQRARGKYIMLLDSDDYLDKKSIKNLVDFFDKYYNEVDLITYPIYWDRNGKISLHGRYSSKNYDKGTGIYDLNQYPHLNQSTVNIMFKNEFANNQLYDTTMKLSEDQNFDTALLMKKNKIGFVEKAKYFYRRHGASVSQTRNNPYYCFEDIMTYNECLLSRYSKNGVVPKYVQTLIINTFNWRVKSDMLLPYHYESELFDSAKERIKNILKQIDNDVIINHSNCDKYVKLYFLMQKGEFVSYNINNDGYKIFCQDITMYEDQTIDCYLYKVRPCNHEISIFASFESPLLELTPVNEYIVRGIYKNGEKFEERYSLDVSNVPFRNTKMKTAHTFPFTYTFDPTKVKKFSFYIHINGYDLTFKPIYIKFSGFVKKFHRNAITINGTRLSYSNHSFKVSHQNLIKDIFDILRTMWFYPRKHIFAIQYFRLKAKTNRKIWLYYDSAGVLDNGYFQFIHDFVKNDGIERYYIMDGDNSDLLSKFTLEQQENIVRYKSKKHKDLFLKSSKIFISFSSLSIYSPFKEFAWYSDVTHYELIYLQHGILHATLQNLYAKEFTEIDKFVISSNFEKENLKQNYDYLDNDFIISGMPRMTKFNQGNTKNKILFAPSWRQYLIGQLVNNRRALKTQEFLASDFYNQIYQFLNSKDLKEILEDNDLYLDFQLHPIFKPYQKYFDLDKNERVNFNFEKHSLDEYKIFITDFSSYQFDYIQLVKPIVYFLPDSKEFKAGLHSYRSLDLKYENAFGPLCFNSNQMIKEIKNIIEHKYIVAEPYCTRMQEFFTVSDNPAETIYNSIIDI